MLPEVVWNMPQLGTFNLHASLLPQYRGAAPINWAIINGDKETGATTFFLTHGIDTGKIIMQKRIPIADNDNAGTVHDRFMVMGASMVTETVDAILDGKETCRIDWNKSAKDIFNFIRGLSPYPAAWCEWEAPDQTVYTVKIFETEVINTTNGKPGTLYTDGKKYIEISCGNGGLRLKVLPLPGKKRLGSIGLFVPILPTTPFWLLTAWLYTRSSPYLYRKVMNIPLFGNCIRNFHEYKAIPLRGKIITITTLWITIGISIWIIAKVWIAILLIAIAIGITIHILSYKTLPPDIHKKKDIH